MTASIKNIVIAGFFGASFLGMTLSAHAGPDENQRYQIWQVIKAKQKAKQEAAQSGAKPCPESKAKAEHSQEQTAN